MQQPATAHSLIGRVLDWWYGVRDSWQRMHELEMLSDHEIERMAKDIGVRPEELVRMMAEPNSTALLLERRLAALSLDPEDIRRLSPLLLADLQRTCALCDEKRRCRQDLDADPAAPGWESYCPNSGTLRTLA